MVVRESIFILDQNIISNRVNNFLIACCPHMTWPLLWSLIGWCWSLLASDWLILTCVVHTWLDRCSDLDRRYLILGPVFVVATVFFQDISVGGCNAAHWSQWNVRTGVNTNKQQWWTWHQIPNIPTELRNISDDVLQASVSSPFQLSRCESGDEALKSHNSSRITIFISRGDTQVYYNMTWCWNCQVIPNVFINSPYIISCISQVQRL